MECLPGPVLAAGDWPTKLDVISPLRPHFPKPCLHPEHSLKTSGYMKLPGGAGASAGAEPGSSVALLSLLRTREQIVLSSVRLQSQGHTSKYPWVCPVLTMILLFSEFLKFILTFILYFTLSHTYSCGNDLYKLIICDVKCWPQVRKRGMNIRPKKTFILVHILDFLHMGISHLLFYFLKQISSWGLVIFVCVEAASR